MFKKSLKAIDFRQLLSLIVTGTLFLGVNIEAAEKKSYSKPPFTAFASQMTDSLSGGGKYEKPVWNLHDALKLPNWLEFSIEQRTRYETMHGCFRGGCKGGDQQIPLQTDVWAQAQFGDFRLGGEFLDARALAVDTGSNVSNAHVNEADFVQGYIAWADQNVRFSGIGVELVAGRQTLNLGSRRLVARNAFRNTINSFTGVKMRLTDHSKWQFTGFVTVPVIRYPTGADQILADVHQWDEEDSYTWFSGGFLEVSDLAFGTNSELYLYRLDEADSPRNPTRNRRYFTPGFRFYIKPAKGDVDFQFETMGQFGTVRGSLDKTDGKNLDHEAWSQHVDVGYTFDVPWSPRLAAEYDYASGDSNSNDNKDQRFDPLYAARRFEFGPTGIYGAFARSNINTPGYRITASPRSDLQLGISHRAFWLASNTDSWTTTGTKNPLRDESGSSNNYIGQQLELTARYDLNSSLNFETGWTHLFKGNFAKEAPNAPASKDIDYFYVQSMLRF